MDMRVTTKPGESSADSAHEARPRPPRRELIIRLTIMALLLLLVLGGLYGFDLFRQKMIAQFFANNLPPPTPRLPKRRRSGTQPLPTCRCDAS